MVRGLALEVADDQSATYSRGRNTAPALAVVVVVDDDHDRARTDDCVPAPSVLDLGPNPIGPKSGRARFVGTDTPHTDRLVDDQNGLIMHPDVGDPEPLQIRRHEANRLAPIGRFARRIGTS